MGSFIFGLDDDDVSVFETALKFVRESDVAVPLFNILTPYPGTRIYNKFVEENRIITELVLLYVDKCFIYAQKNDAG